MWGQKFGFVVGSSLSFLFRHFDKIKGLFLQAVLVVGGITGILAFLLGERLMNGFVSVPIPGSSGFRLEYVGEGPGILLGTLLFFGIIVVFLSILPYAVGIIRATVLDEKVDSAILSNIFTSRSMSYLWALIKIMLMAFVIFIPFFVFAGITMGSAALMTAQGGGAAGVAGAGALIFLAYIATVVILLIFIVRWLLAPVLAALDKGTSLHESRVLTKGYWWLIMLSYFVVAFIVNIGLFIVIFLSALVVGPIALLSPTLGIALGAVVYALVLLLAMIPSGALTGYWYLIMTNQVEFKVPEVSQKAN